MSSLSILCLLISFLSSHTILYLPSTFFVFSYYILYLLPLHSLSFSPFFIFLSILYLLPLTFLPSLFILNLHSLSFISILYHPSPFCIFILCLLSSFLSSFSILYLPCPFFNFSLHSLSFIYFLLKCFLLFTSKFFLCNPHLLLLDHFPIFPLHVHPPPLSLSSTVNSYEYVYLIYNLFKLVLIISRIQFTMVNKNYPYISPTYTWYRPL